VRTANWVSTAGTELTDVSNAASIPVGALVTGPQGVGREVYVTAVNAAQGGHAVGPALGRADAAGVHVHPVQVPARLLGVLNLQRFVVSDIEFLCSRVAVRA
jgi:hypothetical protein